MDFCILLVFCHDIYKSEYDLGKHQERATFDLLQAPFQQLRVPDV